MPRTYGYRVGYPKSANQAQSQLDSVGLTDSVKFDLAARRTDALGLTDSAQGAQSAGVFTLRDSDFDNLTVANPIGSTNMVNGFGISASPAKTSVVAVSGHGNVVRQTYPTDDVGGSAGISVFPDLSRAVDDVTMAYDLKFNGASFDWGWGGKLPGPAGTRSTTNNPPTGGVHDEDGWTARNMWITPAAGFSSENPQSPVELIGYTYDPTQGTGFGKNRRTGVVITPNVWHRVAVQVVMNTVTVDGTGDANGIHRIWWNGALVFEKLNQIWRVHADVHANKYAWSTFYGGGTVDWAPATQQTIDFDNLLITTPEAA